MRKILLVLILTFQQPTLARPQSGSERLAGDLSSDLTGIFSAILIHESGHALAVKAMGWELVAFRPYPHMVNGQWVGGLVKHIPSTSGTVSEKRQKHAIVSGSGSLFNFAVAAALTPLLPEIKSDFGAAALNTYIITGMFDWFFYATIDMIYMTFGKQKKSVLGDWQKVAANSGINIYWWWLISAGATAMAYQQYDGAREKAINEYNVKNGIQTATLPLFVTKWSF